MGAARLVPPPQHSICCAPPVSPPINTHGVPEISATSGISRLESLGTPGPVCQAGLGKMLLAPPPLDPHALSMPPGATPTTLRSLPEASNCGLNWVPPTPVTCGLAASSLGLRAVPSTQLLVVESYCIPAAPQSPVLTKTDWPCAAACANWLSKLVKSVLVELQKTKLMLIAPQRLSVIAAWIDLERLPLT